MGLRINNNILALKGQNALSRTSTRLNTALERLSTGLRINKGADDVVGLLKSESLRSQIRGISAAENNISNAQSLLGVAEGSLSELTNLAQLIREKVVQAADDSISSTDRSNLTTAVNDLLSEYSRVASASEFDGVSLLNGTFTSKAFQVGPNAGDTLSFSLNDARSASVGTVAVLTSITVTTTAIGVSATFANPSGIVINNISLETTAFSSDGVSSFEASESAIAYVNAINSISGQTGVTAQTLANVVTIDVDNGSADAISAADTLSINGVALAQADYTADATGATSLAAAINDVSIQTGVSAVATGGDVVLTAADGRNIVVNYDNVAENDNLFGVTISTSDTAELGYRGTFRLSSDSDIVLAGADEINTTAAATITTGTSFTLQNLSVSSASSAETGLFIMDSVIRQLQTRRSDVGSKSIRMQVAESELKTRKENLAAAESVIRDTDVAMETANLTSAQIIQQASISTLTRANGLPQLALSLLQG